MSDHTPAVGGASGLGYAGDVDCNEAWDILNRDAAAVLVRTGKFRDDDLSRRAPKPDLILDSVASLPAALGVAFS